MPQNSEVPNQVVQRQRALSRWDNEGGAAGPVADLAADEEKIPTPPEMSNADLVALRVRVIALENLLISLLATASDEQLELAHEMAGYISPRPYLRHSAVGDNEFDIRFILKNFQRLLRGSGGKHGAMPPH